MIDLAENYQGVDVSGQDFIAYHSGIQKQSESLVGVASNNLDNYQRDLISAQLSEERAEETLSEAQGLYDEFKTASSQVLDPMKQDIRNLRDEIRGMVKSGAPSVSVGEYKS